MRTGLLPDEQASLDTHIWIAWTDLGSLPGGRFLDRHLK